MDLDSSSNNFLVVSSSKNGLLLLFMPISFFDLSVVSDFRRVFTPNTKQPEDQKVDNSKEEHPSTSKDGTKVDPSKDDTKIDPSKDDKIYLGKRS